MNNLKRYTALSFFACWLILASCNGAQAQDRNTAAEVSASAKSIEINYEIQLYLLVASNTSAERNNLPRALDGVVRQLKATLPFNTYRLTTTFLSRVGNGSNLEVKGIVGGSPFATAASAVPTFYEFTLTNVRMVTDTDGQQLVRISAFRFGQRVPVQTSTTRAEGSTTGFPVIQYEPTGITTQVSLHEGTPAIIGTSPTGQSDELFVLAASIKRTDSR